MGKGFESKTIISKPIDEVWSYISDFNNADKWMTGVTDLRPKEPGSICKGSKLFFQSRGSERESEITAWEPLKMMELTSTQAGVTATYAYSLKSMGDKTELKLNAGCIATGFWKILHPIIIIAMRASDSKHPVQIKNAIEG
ncbi:MAG: hypothetical protein NPINA01_06110 [Nitrospinaceae bacterium]|nr:MAG: hypothetical protein NPINA01_06110 [Nitrospinaceae bacterium]